MKVVLFIGELKAGGAERQIINLANGIAARTHRVFLITIFPGGNLCSLVSNSEYLTHIPVWNEKKYCKISRFFQILFSPIILIYLLSRIQPNIVYSFLGLTNLIAWIATRFGFSKKLVWGLRSGKRKLVWKQSIPDLLSRLISRSVPLVIANSELGKEYYFHKGYRPIKMCSIPNGVDVDYFKPYEKAGTILRNKLNIKEGKFVIGIAGRINPVKNLELFFHSAEIVLETNRQLVFVVVGAGEMSYIEKLKKLNRKLQIEQHVIWIGFQDDMIGVYNLFDLLVSSSSVEGSPNTVLEAMACGTPCIVTDVGDSARIVNDPNCVVPPGYPEALSAAINQFIETDHSPEYKSLLRKRIVDNYSIEIMVQRTMDAFRIFIPLKYQQN